MVSAIREPVFDIKSRTRQSKYRFGMSKRPNGNYGVCISDKYSAIVIAHVELPIKLFAALEHLKKIQLEAERIGRRDNDGMSNGQASFYNAVLTNFKNELVTYVNQHAKITHKKAVANAKDKTQHEDEDAHMDSGLMVLPDDWLPQTLKLSIIRLAGGWDPDKSDVELFRLACQTAGVAPYSDTQYDAALSILLARWKKESIHDEWRKLIPQRPAEMKRQSYKLTPAKKRHDLSLRRKRRQLVPPPESSIERSSETESFPAKPITSGTRSKKSPAIEEEDVNIEGEPEEELKPEEKALPLHDKSTRKGLPQDSSKCSSYQMSHLQDDCLTASPGKNWDSLDQMEYSSEEEIIRPVVKYIW